MRSFIRELRTRFELLVAWSRLMKSLLYSYDMLLAVSRAVVHEMGEEFSSKFYIRSRCFLGSPGC
ncbi:MAG: hypothetical protein QW373_05200 [Desulfurococcaceae archaeon]